VTEDDREQPFRVGTRAGEFVSVANAAGFDLNQDFASLRAVEVQSHDLQGLARGICNCGFGFHS
jgi:hypothetical protein